MESDKHGCSTCPPGQERWEEFHWSWDPTEKRVQYDYRTPDGKLFACVAHTLEEARAMRDKWLVLKGAEMKMEFYEPWRISEHYPGLIFDQRGGGVCGISDIHTQRGEAQRRRIVECVNALVGIDDPATFIKEREKLRIALRALVALPYAGVVLKTLECAYCNGVISPILAKQTFIHEGDCPIFKARTLLHELEEVE